VFLENHKERTHAKKDGQWVGVYEVENEEDQRKLLEDMAEKDLKKDSRWREINGN
jgi:hypothetical protein